MTIGNGQGLVCGVSIRNHIARQMFNQRPRIVQNRIHYNHKTGCERTNFQALDDEKCEKKSLRAIFRARLRHHHEHFFETFPFSERGILVSESV